MTLSRPFLALAFLLCASPLVPAASFGPFFFAKDAPAPARFAAAGPFVERLENRDTGERATAWFRPFFATGDHPGEGLEGRHDWDALWPLAQGKRYAGETSWRVLLAYDRQREDGTQSRFLIFPLWVHGHEKDEQYAGLFPIWGNAPKFFFLDRLEWRFWPIWMRTTSSDATTTSWFWPFVAKTETPDGHLSKRRVWPFYMRHDRRGEFTKQSVLWPFWSTVDYHYPSERGHAWIFFPFAGRVKTTKQDEWMAIPPLVRWGKSDRGTLVQAWPFYRRVTGWRDERTVWPLFSRTLDDAGVRGYALWPFWWYQTSWQGAEKTTRFTLAPVFSQKTRLRRPALSREENRDFDRKQRTQRLAAVARGERADEAALAAERFARHEAAGPYEVVARRTMVWPLFTWEWDDDLDASRFRALDLWPGNDPVPVARSWAPLWTLVDFRRTGTYEQSELLWGLYRAHEDTATGESAREIFPLWNRKTGAEDASFGWSIGKGLIAFDRFEDGRKRIRFLWLPRWTWGGEDEAEPAAETTE